MPRCSCLPTYNPPGPPPFSCPEGCMSAQTVLYTIAEGLSCDGILVVDLSDLVNVGTCEGGITYSTLSDGGLDVVLVGDTLTITNDSTNDALAGTFVNVIYKAKCNGDIRSVSGTLSIYITDVCE